MDAAEASGSQQAKASDCNARLKKFAEVALEVALIGLTVLKLNKGYTATSTTSNVEFALMLQVAYFRFYVGNCLFYIHVLGNESVAAYRQVDFNIEARRMMLKTQWTSIGSHVLVGGILDLCIVILEEASSPEPIIGAAFSCFLGYLAILEVEKEIRPSPGFMLLHVVALGVGLSLNLLLFAVVSKMMFAFESTGATLLFAQYIFGVPSVVAQVYIGGKTLIIVFVLQLILM
jgi:hypothetical protein